MEIYSNESRENGCVCDSTVSVVRRFVVVVCRIVLNAVPGSEFKCVQSRRWRVVPQQRSSEIIEGRAAEVFGKLEGFRRRAALLLLAYRCMYTFRQVRDRDSLAVTNSDAAPPYSVVLERSEDSLARRRLLDRTPMVGPFNTCTVHGRTPQADYRFELTEIDVEPQVLAPWLMRIPQK